VPLLILGFCFLKIVCGRIPMSADYIFLLASALAFIIRVYFLNTIYIKHLLILYITTAMTTGIIRNYHDNEKTRVKEEYFVFGDKREGHVKIYDYHGQLDEIYNCVDDKIEGTKLTFYTNGSVRSISHYVNGMRQGEYRYYHTNGQLWYYGIYDNDVYDGDFETYDSNGLLTSVCYYKSGALCLRP
jgi:antitoxin component YwqK of YwqJK toxin-antitoxin module